MGHKSVIFVPSVALDHGEKSKTDCSSNVAFWLRYSRKRCGRGPADTSTFIFAEKR